MNWKIILKNEYYLDFEDYALDKNYNVIEADDEYSTFKLSEKDKRELKKIEEKLSDKPKIEIENALRNRIIEMANEYLKYRDG
tara:strand:+ start:3139 stop:3387 length:249 start_codon:yes stop_codon:yes gene_type:complete